MCSCYYDLHTLLAPTKDPDICRLNMSLRLLVLQVFHSLILLARFLGEKICPMFAGFCNSVFLICKF